MRSPFAILCRLSVAASAILIFLLGPLFAKIAMPILGGAADVWIAGLMFYQIALLAGALYAHLSSSLPLRLQWPLHAVFGAAALLVLPLVLPLGGTPPANANPASALLLMMAASAGAPLVALAAMTPLVPRWFSLARPGANPYPLFAFGNAGGLAALIAFPLLADPAFAAPAQARDWSFAYGAVIAAIPCIGLAAWRAPGAKQSATPAGRKTPLTAGLTLRWILLAAIPSSLLLSLIRFIGVDAGAPPPLQVLPLALYLATLIFAFSSKSDVFGRPTRALYPILMIASCIGLTPAFANLAPTTAPLRTVALAAFAFAALGCHGELARIKPDASRLTFFFLALSLGGALGGLFSALVAPAVFNDVAAFPIGLILAAVLIGAGGERQSRRLHAWRSYIWAALAAGGAAFIAVALFLPASADSPESRAAQPALRGPLAETGN